MSSPNKWWLRLIGEKASRQASIKSKMWWRYSDVQCNRGCQPRSSVQISYKQTRPLFISFPIGWLWPRDNDDISCRLSVPRLNSAFLSTSSLAHGICPLRAARNRQPVVVGNGILRPSVLVHIDGSCWSNLIIFVVASLAPISVTSDGGK